MRAAQGGKLGAGGQRRPRCEEKTGPGPAGEGTLGVRPGDRADAGSQGAACFPTKEGLGLHTSGVGWD